MRMHKYDVQQFTQFVSSFVDQALNQLLINWSWFTGFGVQLFLFFQHSQITRTQLPKVLLQLNSYDNYFNSSRESLQNKILIDFYSCKIDSFLALDLFISLTPVSSY